MCYPNCKICVAPSMVCEKMYQEKIWELMNKPHAPTIKAVIEALIEAFKVMRKSNARVGSSLHVVSLDNGTYYLESILKDL